MVRKDPNIIKKIVCKNFDSSAALYDRFEQRFGLFERLTGQLAEVCNIHKGMTVCDVGCGTGTSTQVLAGLVGKSGTVFGIDFSENMLTHARARIGSRNDSKPDGTNNIEFIRSDADDIMSAVKVKLDSILYNACIFLIPEPKRTLQSAFQILKQSGTVGFNYLIGVYAKHHTSKIDDNELFRHAGNDKHTDKKSFTPYGRQITDTSVLPTVLCELGFSDVQQGLISIEMQQSQLQEFYSIPAQSAALWPRNTYEERLEHLLSLMKYFNESNINNFYQRWGWYTAKK